MDHFRQDIQYSLRRLLKAPGFTAIALIIYGVWFYRKMKRLRIIV